MQPTWLRGSCHHGLAEWGEGQVWPPPYTGGETGPDAGVLPPSELCWRRFPWPHSAGSCGFGLASPSSCLSLPISAVGRLTLPPTHLPAVRAREPTGLPIPAPRALLLGVSFKPPSGSGRRSSLKLAGGITLMGPWPNGEASCFETPRLPGAAAQVPWGRGASAPPRQAWVRGWHPGISLPVCFLAGE